MKKQTLLTLIIATAITMTINAQTIALHSSTGVQIIKGSTAFADAYTTAQSGDTLYLSGGSFAPPAAFDKKLMIFGAGHYVDSTLATGKTFINGNVTLSENADMFYIEGVEITGNFYFSSDNSVNNVVIKRCKINGALNVPGNGSNPTSNLSLIGNVLIGELDLQNATVVLISNSILQSRLVNSLGNILNNNIMLNNYVYWGNESPIYGDNNILNNNIFLKNDYPYIINGNGNVVKNNLCVNSAPYFGEMSTTIGNYTGIAQSAIFVSQTGFSFSYSHNYHLQEPTTYLGTDGTQVGIYGGAFPYKEGAVPLNPHIQIKNIAPTTDENGNLQIQIQVGAQND